MGDQQSIYSLIEQLRQQGRKGIAMLLDPDKLRIEELPELIGQAHSAAIDLLFVGGSLVMDPDFDQLITRLKALTRIPIVLFPGSPSQVCPAADGILLLSLLSGRNADLLIGQHVLAAPVLAKSGLEILSTGYLIIDGGRPTTVSYISNSSPIPANKPQIALCTALAGQQLGMKLIYLDSGSGADQPVPKRMIKAVRKAINIPLIIGGGIRTPEQALDACRAGADLIVVGNAFEKDPELIPQIADAVHKASMIDVDQL